MKRALIVMITGALALQTTGCMTTEAERSAAIGSGIGAGVGAILGNNFGGSRDDRELGIAAGALLGGLVGHNYGQQQDMRRQMISMQQDQLFETLWIENTNGSRTPVVLRRAEGGQYIGPRGEYYTGRPSEEQLRKVYGI